MTRQLRPHNRYLNRRRVRGESARPAALVLLAVAAFAVMAPATARAMTSTTATLQWTATGDNGNSGTAASYQIRYSATALGADTTGWWNAATAVGTPPPPAAAGTIQSVGLTGLTPSTTYRALVVALDEAGNRSPYSNVTTWTTPSDSVTAVISNITNQILPGVLAITILWQTDLPATSQVEFGLTPAYGSSTPLDPALVTSHSVTLTSAQISNDLVYNYRVKSKSASGPVAASVNRTFKVDAVAPARILDLTAN